MGRLALVARLVARDLRNRPAEAVLLLLAITAAATSLTLGLVLHGVTSGPYQRTSAATAGPDIVADVGPGPNPNQHAVPANLTPLTKTPGVTASSGPFPVLGLTLHANGYTVPAMAEGRDPAPSAVDRPLLTAGSWVKPGSVVLERSFASALGVRPGQTITLNGRGYLVSGIAVSAALPPYPLVCAVGCDFVASEPPGQPGLIWMTRTDLLALPGARADASWYLNLRLSDPASAGAYANAYDSTHPNWSAPSLTSWQYIASAAGRGVSTEQEVLLIGSSLLGLLAIASVAVLAGGRMAGQVRRVGLLKAAGATPGLVALVLLAEHLLVAVVAAGLGLVFGWLAAPLLASPGAGLLGSADPASLTLQNAGLVVVVALAVALLATVVPAIRGARTSTVSALDNAARAPKRRALVTKLSRRMPVSLLLGMRIAARRPRRTVLGLASVTVTVAGVVTVLMAHARFDTRAASSGTLPNPVNNDVIQVTTVITIALIVLAAVNALLLTYATVLDARRPSALSRALGATAGQVSAGLAAAQMLPALAGAIIGTPLGFLLYASIKHGSTMTYPPVWWLACVVLGTPLVVGALTVIPSRVASRAEIAPVLQSGAA
ncbi:MAG TPA: FtsX-like permease family protein [Trebonia sp.]|jgi:putative ABC transport system permease protein|nr:FtsX-like permease family protein [Trebonia sp.]